MKTYEEFKILKLRPAYYNETEFEIDVEFDDVSFSSVRIEIAKAINMIVGDTAKINGKIFTEETDYEYITIYMCGEALADFIEKYGVSKINAKVRLMLEQVYTVYESREDYCFEPKEKELTVYKLVKIINDDKAI